MVYPRDRGYKKGKNMNRINYTSEEIYNSLTQLEESYSDMADHNFNRLVLSRYEYECYRGRYFSLLLDEAYIEGNEEEANNVLYYSASLMYRALVEELSIKQIKKNIDTINQLITTQVKEDDFKNTTTIIERYDDTIFVLLNLKHEETNPLLTFERFISDYCIKLRSGEEKARFKVQFLEETVSEKRKEWLYFNNLHEFFDICNIYLMDTIRRDICNYIEIGTPLIPKLMPSNIDMSKLKSISTAKDFYNYLVSFEGVKANAKLDALYLLTHYENISIFTDETLMDKILERIEFNLNSEEYKQVAGGYFPHSIVKFPL